MYQNFQNLKRVYLFLSMFVFVALLGRLAQLQLFDRERYFRESERNRVREVIIEAPRGIIYDRNGTVLVDNRPAYSVSVVPYEFLKADSSVELLSAILQQQPNQLKQKINKDKYGNFIPVKVKRQIGFKALSHLEEHKLELPGVFYSIESRRMYPGGLKAPHMFGYLGEVTSEDLSQLQGKEYRLGDVIGKNGLEYQYEDYLRGKDGVEYIEVDVLGREIRRLPELSTQIPEPGKNIYLTIDARIQRYLEESMADKKGAAVVLNPQNGEILAIVSQPDFDPELFTNPLTPEIWDELINHPDKPLYNRACQSLFPPGSTFKLVLAAAGLETDKIQPSHKVFCPGYYQLGRRAFACWKKGGHGEVDFLGAIEQSCNVYFYTKGLEVGLVNWAKYAKLFQFGKKTGVDLPNESAGLVPDHQYFDQKYGERGWTRGLLLNLAVGQGDLLTTPLQMAYFAMILGNEGLAFRPHLLQRIENPASGESVFMQPDSLRIDEISRDTYRKIKQGMYLVVNGGHGTGRASWVPGLQACGKTGTAQNPHGEDHAWFIGFAPMEQPEIAFCIFVENGGSGGAVAAPIARGFLTLLQEKQTVALN